MPQQPAGIRISNFEEVAKGYDINMALAEASRCLQCKKRPCVNGCPVGINIPVLSGQSGRGSGPGCWSNKRIQHVARICGRVCPQETQCEHYCVLNKTGNPIAIGRLERFVADWERNNQPDNGPQKYPVRLRVKK